MRTRRIEPPRRGFTLIELMIVIAVIGAVGGVTSAAIVAMGKLANAASAAPYRIERAAEFGRMFREDSHRADDWSLDGNTLTLYLERGSVIYAASAGGATRTAGESPPELFPFDGAVAFELADGVASVTVEPDDGSKLASVPLRFDAGLGIDSQGAAE